MGHVVLLGDSTLDNAAYVAAGEHVSAQLQQVLGPRWRVTLLAIDGDVIRGVAAQLTRLPADASHLVISVGGNDALRHAAILSDSARSVAEALGKLARAREEFAADYRNMLDQAPSIALPTAICTIYEGALPDPVMSRLGRTALTALNDVITREAAGRGLPLIDLRVIFSADEDYANPIEPSATGGRKFAAAIAAMLAEHDFSRRRCEVFVGPA